MTLSKIWRAKNKFEELLLKSRICPLTVAYHGSCYCIPNKESDIDVVLIVEKIEPNIFRKLHYIKEKIDVHLGLTILSAREGGTIFGGMKYLDALHRSIGHEKYPLAYYEIAALNALFRKNALELNFKKCLNLAKIITKLINNWLGSNLKLRADNLDSLITSLEHNLNFFYVKEKIKPGKYKEEVRLKKALKRFKKRL